MGSFLVVGSVSYCRHFVFRVAIRTGDMSRCKIGVYSHNKKIMRLSVREVTHIQVKSPPLSAFAEK